MVLRHLSAHIITDGITITGSGTADDPLVGHSGTGSSFLAATQVAFGSALNVMTSSRNITFVDGTSTLTVGQTSTTQGHVDITGSKSGFIDITTNTTSSQFIATTVTDVYFGNGVTNAAPSAYIIHGTGGVGSDKTGANITIVGGASTGSAAGGSVFIATTPAGTTGSTANVSSTVIECNQQRSSIFNGRVQGKRGASVASANNATLGYDGNAFVFTGTTQLNLIDITDWADGSWIFLTLGKFTIKHNQTASGNFKPIKLAASADFSASIGDRLLLCLNNGVWEEHSRTTV